MINRQEIVRYLGYGKNQPDEVVSDLIEECIKEVEAAAEPKCVYRRFTLTIGDDNHIYIAGLDMKSNNLAKNLKGCEEAVLFAATLGVGVDRLLNKNLRFNMAKASVIQATAAAYIEDFCNQKQLEIEEIVNNEGKHLRPRFSPGYGDLNIEIQESFLRAINAGKMIGVTLSDGNIMIPEKSVSAIMGISSSGERCHIEGCEVCDNINCQFRR